MGSLPLQKLAAATPATEMFQEESTNGIHQELSTNTASLQPILTVGEKQEDAGTQNLDHITTASFPISQLVETPVKEEEEEDLSNSLVQENACVEELQHAHQEEDVQQTEIERLEKEFISELEALVTPKPSPVQKEEEERATLGEEEPASIEEKLQKTAQEELQQTTPGRLEKELLPEPSLVQQEEEEEAAHVKKLATVEELQEALQEEPKQINNERVEKEILSGSSPVQQEEEEERAVHVERLASKLSTAAKPRPPPPSIESSSSVLVPAFANKAEEKLFVPCLAYLAELMAYDKRAWPRTADDLHGKLGSVYSPTNKFAFLRYHLGVVCMRVNDGVKTLSWDEQRIMALVQGKETLVVPKIRFIRYMIAVHYNPPTYEDMLACRLWKEFSQLPKLDATEFFQSLASENIIAFNATPCFRHGRARAVLKKFDCAPHEVVFASSQSNSNIAHSFTSTRDREMFTLAIQRLRALLNRRESGNQDDDGEECALPEARNMDMPLLAYLRHHMAVVFQRKAQDSTVFYLHKPRAVAFLSGVLPLVSVEMRFLRYALATNYNPIKYADLLENNGDGALWSEFNCVLDLDANKLFRSLEHQGIISRTTIPVFRCGVAKSVLVKAEAQYPAIEEQCRRQCIRELTSITTPSPPVAVAPPVEATAPPANVAAPAIADSLFINDEEQRVFKLAIGFLQEENQRNAWAETLNELIARLGEENQAEIRSFLMFHLGVVQFVPSRKGGEGNGPTCKWDKECIKQVLFEQKPLNTPKIRFLRHAAAIAYRPTSYSALVTDPVWTQFNKLLNLDTTEFFHDLEQDGIVSQTVSPVLNLERAALLFSSAAAMQQGNVTLPKLTGLLLVNTIELLEQFCEQGKHTWNHCDVVAITVVADAIGEEEFASVQVASQHHVAVFDCQALGTSVVCAALRTLLESNNVVKLFHDLHFAVRVIVHLVKQIVPSNMLDTQLLCEQVQGRLDVGFCDAIELFSDGHVLPSLPASQERVIHEAQLLLSCWSGINQLFASGSLDRFVSASKIRAATAAAIRDGAWRSVWFDADLKLCSGELLLHDDGAIPSPLTVHTRLDVLLQLLPQRMVIGNKTLQENENNITEIILDKGKLPYLHVAAGEHRLVLCDQVVTEEEIASVVDKLGGDAKFSRERNCTVALERELHRVSALRNAQENIYGLTLHVGRFVSGGVAESIQDLLMLDGRSILVVGPTESGKTTLLRDVVRLVSTKKRVCVVDTTNELGGDSDIAADCLGDARRVMVSPTRKQSNIIVECMRNFHTSKGTTMVIDEIGEEDIQVLRTMQHNGSGMRLIAGMCSRDFRTLVENTATIWGSVTKRTPIFDIVLQLSVDPVTLEHTISIITNVAKAVDMVLAGEQIPIQVRKRHVSTGKLFIKVCKL